MKAFLLAAGLGTRLRPITDTLPKVLVEVGGRPMLDIWLDALAAAGVDEVLVNLHHLPDQVRDHVAARESSVRRPAPVVRLVHEPELLGSAGTLLRNRDFVAGEEAFLAVNADNLTDADVRALIEAHRAGGELATLSVFHAPVPSACGILETDAGGRVIGFEEKPEHPRSDLANAGLYAFSPAVLDLLDPLQGGTPQDIGYHLLPRLVGRARAFDLGDAFLVDVGTHEALHRARTEWKERQVQ